MKRRTFCTTALGLPLAMGLNQPLRANSKPELFVPAEEEPHQATFMQFPTDLNVYEDRWFLSQVQQTIADIANAIAEFEPVIMLADSSAHKDAKRLLTRDVELWDVPTQDLWCRDSGPIFAKKPDGSLAITHIQFNGWGNKQNHIHDGKIAARVAERLGLDLIDSGVVGEGGGLDHDGHSLLIAHESSWVHKGRNPKLNRTEIETRLLTAYGAKKMIWSKGVWNQDITDYHIDSLARFTGPNRVLINLPVEPDPDDPFHQAALQTHDILMEEGLEVDVIYEPEQRRVNAEDFVASYVNYYVCNGALIIAAFGDKRADAAAVKAMQKHYPGREIVTLNTDALGEIGGGIHCATQQMPA